jgi:hypothetical protein
MTCSRTSDHPFRADELRPVHKNLKASTLRCPKCGMGRTSPLNIELVTKKTPVSS